MANDSVPINFRRGLLPLVVLSLLESEDMYGYQLVQEAERRSGGAIVTQEGSLYPVLYKLLETGLITDRRMLAGKRMTRVYYHLEDAGKAHLEALAREYRTMVDGMLRLLDRGDGHERD
ncbi:MAG: helix-turn-helix transcriptional regulator [Oscillospiraceae bacterium]|nr:helix-turn-helix transcriptional regulator [Oscillospiraceae bacterium]